MSQRFFDLPVLALIDVVLVHRIGVVELAGLSRTVRRWMPKVVGTLCGAGSCTKRSIEGRVCEQFRADIGIVIGAIHWCIYRGIADRCVDSVSIISINDNVPGLKASSRLSQWTGRNSSNHRSDSCGRIEIRRISWKNGRIRRRIDKIEINALPSL